MVICFYGMYILMYFLRIYREIQTIKLTIRFLNVHFVWVGDFSVIIVTRQKKGSLFNVR